jgi:sorbitol-specific phosphotransferase system component IIA
MSEVGQEARNSIVHLADIRICFGRFYNRAHPGTIFIHPLNVISGNDVLFIIFCESYFELKVPSR